MKASQWAGSFDFYFFLIVIISLPKIMGSSWYWLNKGTCLPAVITQYSCKFLVTWLTKRLHLYPLPLNLGCFSDHLTNRMWQKCNVTIPGLAFIKRTGSFISWLLGILVICMLPFATQQPCNKEPRLLWYTIPPELPANSQDKWQGFELTILSIQPIWILRWLQSQPTSLEQKHYPGKFQRNNKMVTLLGH